MIYTKIIFLLKFNVINCRYTCSFIQGSFKNTDIDRKFSWEKIMTKDQFESAYHASEIELGSGKFGVLKQGNLHLSKPAKR